MPAVLQDQPDQDGTLRDESLAPGGIDGVRLDLLREGQRRVDGARGPTVRRTSGSIGSTGAELIRPCLDLVLRLVGERRKCLLAQDVNDDDLGARDAGCKDGRLKRRRGRRPPAGRGSRLNRTGTSQSGGTTTTGLRMEVATRAAT